eukprot:2739321-Amphidinium_carterae.1
MSLLVRGSQHKMGTYLWSWILWSLDMFGQDKCWWFGRVWLRLKGEDAHIYATCAGTRPKWIHAAQL